LREELRFARGEQHDVHDRYTELLGRIQCDQAPEVRLQARYADVDSPEAVFKTLTRAIGSTALFCGLLKPIFSVHMQSVFC
jgi:hypothetical protein